MSIGEAPPTTRAGSARAFARRLRMPVLILAIAAGFCWKLVLTRQYEWMAGPDLANQILPWLEMEAQQWHSGSFPVWDPHLWAGQPIVGQGQPGAAYPLNWLLFSMPLRHGHIMPSALAWYRVAIHFMAALLCYAFARSLGRSRHASLLAGIVFSFGCFLSFYDWPQMMNGAVWGPAVLLFLFRVRSHGKPADAALAGASLGMSWLSGHHQVPIYLTLTLAAFYIWCWFDAKPRRARFATLAALSGIVFLLTAGLQLIPSWEYGHTALRWVGAAEPVSWAQPVPYAVHEHAALGPLSIIGIVIPGTARYGDLFVGLVAFALTLLAVARCWQDWRVRFLAALTFSGFLYALGGATLFQGWLYAIVPFVEKARTPTTGVYLFGLGCAALAAFGMDELRSPYKSLRRYVLALTIFGCGLGTTVFILALVHKMGYDDRTPLVVVWALLLAAVLHGVSRGVLPFRQAATLCVLLSIFEIGANFGATWPSRDNQEGMTLINRMRGFEDVAAYLKVQPGLFRIETDGSEMVPNWADRQGLDAMAGILAGLTSNIYSNVDFWSGNTRMLFGVRYTVGRKPTAPAQVEVYSSPSGMKVYLNPDTFPRAWIVHTLVSVADNTAGKRMIQDHLSDLRRSAWVSGPATLSPDTPPAVPSGCQGLPGGAGDTLSIQQFAVTRQRFQANLACAGFLIVADTYAAGWRATVDGRGAPVFEVNGAMQGVAVPAGYHAIEVRYFPVPVFLGAVLSMLGILMAGILVLRDRRSARLAGDIGR